MLEDDRLVILEQARTVGARQLAAQLIVTLLLILRHSELSLVFRSALRAGLAVFFAIGVIISYPNDISKPRFPIGLKIIPCNT